jgi:hypothetical protein
MPKLLPLSSCVRSNSGRRGGKQDMDDSNFEKIKRELLTLCDAVSQTLRFNAKAVSGGKVALAVDYSLVAGYVRPAKSVPGEMFIDVGFDRDIDKVGRRIFEQYPRFAESAPYRLVLSAPTVMEFELSTARMAGEAHELLRSANDMDALYEAFMRYIEADGSPTAIDDVGLFQRAKRTFETLNHTMDANALPRFLEQIRKGYIHGLGTYFRRSEFESAKPEIYRTTRDIWNFLNEQKKSRQGRDVYHYFNNFVDAMNLSLSYYLDKLHDDISISYVAPYPPGLENDKIRSAVRHRSTPASLQLDLAARELTAGRKHPNTEALDWLTTCFDRAKICKDYLANANSATELSDVKKREVQYFYTDYMNPTFGKAKDEISPEQDYERAKALFSDKATFRKRFEDSVSLAKDTEIALGTLQPLIESEELFSDLGLMDDPQILEIRKRIDTKLPGPR